MGLTNENVAPKILAKIKIYVLTRAELLFKVCYEIPCMYTMLLVDIQIWFDFLRADMTSKETFKQGTSLGIDETLVLFYNLFFPSLLLIVKVRTK